MSNSGWKIIFVFKKPTLFLKHYYYSYDTWVSKVPREFCDALNTCNSTGKWVSFFGSGGCPWIKPALSLLFQPFCSYHAEASEYIRWIPSERRNTCTRALAINECLVCPQVPYVKICIAMMPGSLHQLWHCAGLVLLVKVYFGYTLYYNTTLQLTVWACCGFSVCFESKTEEASKQIASMSSPAGMLSIWNSDVNRQLLPVLWRFSNTSCTIVWHDPDCNV